MDLSLFFAILGGLLVLAFVANRLVRFTRVPDVIILMATGVLIGPALHWVNPEIFRGATPGFGSLALILILFEGGLDLKIGEIARHFGAGFFLSIFSYVLSMMAVAGISHYVMHLPWLDALLTGAILGCIGGSILLPVLQQVRLRREVKVTLLIEASLGDAFAVLAVSTLLDVAAGGNAAPRAVAWTLASSLILAVGTGILAGMLWSYLLPVLSEEHFCHVLTFAAVLLVYSGVHFLKGNELVSVLVFGLTLSNFHTVRKRLHLDKSSGSDWFTEMPVKNRYGHLHEDHQRDQMLTFHGELAFLLRTFFFVLLGMLVDFAGLRSTALFAFLCFAAILAAREAAVQAGRFGWRTFSARERELMVWFIPRGLISAVLAIEVLDTRGSEVAFLPSLAFAIIVLSSLILLVGTFRARKLPAPGVETAEGMSGGPAAARAHQG
jgi:potassium/hydrogen antiporter